MKELAWIICFRIACLAQIFVILMPPRVAVLEGLSGLMGGDGSREKAGQFFCPIWQNAVYLPIDWPRVALLSLAVWLMLFLIFPPVRLSLKPVVRPAEDAGNGSA